MTKNILNDNELRILLKKITSIVMIGVSASPLRASFFVARYFVLRGISVSPINPNYDGEYLNGITNSRATTGVLTFTVSANTPQILYFNCGLHSGMGGTINITENSSQTNQNFVEIFRGSTQHTVIEGNNALNLRLSPPT